MEITDKRVDLFWRKVQKQDGHGCWIWTASKLPKGYGQFWWVRDTGDYACGLAHRFSWEIHNGPIPQDLYVLHTCDTPECVRPDHLWLGTKADNNRDRDEKGRQARGEKNGTAKLTENNVREIRVLVASGISGVTLSRRFGVSGQCISKIVHKKKWKSI